MKNFNFISSQLVRFTLAAAIVVLTGVGARAEMRESGGYLGALAGITSLNNGGGTSFTYGADLGFKFASPWSIGVDYTYNTYSVASPWSANFSTLLANIRYYCSAGFFAGVKLGTSTFSVSGSGAPASTSNFTWGPVIGFDHYLSNKFSLGAQADYLWISNTNPTSTALQVLANLNYHF